MAVFPAGTFTTPNRVVLISRGRQEEAVVGATKFYPGNLVMDDGTGNGTYIPHNVQGGWAELMVAVEQGLQGIGGSTTPKGAFDSYDIGTQAQYWVCAKGDVINVTLATGNNATENALLMSNGDGNFALLPSAANLGGNLYETTAASTALTNTTTETVFSTGSTTIPANYFQAGDILHVRAQGIITSFNSTDTITVNLYLGGLTGTKIVATAALNGSANDEFLIDAYIELRTVGSSGTFIANGIDTIGTPGTATAKPFLLGSTAVDTTAAQAVAISGKWSVANAADSCRLDYMTVDLIRQSGGFKALAVVQSAINNTSGTTGLSFSPAALCQVRVL